MDVDEHTIELGGGPVFYYRAPRGGTPVVYLHGVPTSADDWVPFLELTGGIAPDLPGFGRSTKAGHLDYSMAGHADFLEGFLDALGISRFALVAHGWGAAGGLVLAQRHPARIARLVLIDAVPLLAGFHWHRLARAWRAPVLGELIMGSTPKRLLFHGLRQASGSEWSQARLAAVWEHFDQGTQRAILRLHRDGDPSRLAAAGLGLDDIEAPALVVWGERDPWFGVELAARYAERLPHAQVQIVEGAGHWPWLGRPEAVSRVVSFLGS